MAGGGVVTLGRSIAFGVCELIWPTGCLLIG